MLLESHDLLAIDMTSMVRESERDFTTLLSCGQPSCFFTTAYKKGLLKHQERGERLSYDKDDERLKDIRRFPQPSNVTRLPPLPFEAVAGLDAKMASRLKGQHTLNLAFEKPVPVGKACVGTEMIDVDC